MTEQLKPLFLNGKSQKARQLAIGYLDNPQHGYDNFEDQINRLGYTVVNEQNTKAALEVFKLNIELYPNSANCYDSLAECYWKQGELDLAIKNYERALEMDPHGPTGANATRMLQQVRAQAQSSSQK